MNLWAIPFIAVTTAFLITGVVAAVLDRLDRRRRPKLHIVRGGARAVCHHGAERRDGGAA